MSPDSDFEPSSRSSHSSASACMRATEDEGGLAHVFLRLPEALNELGLFAFVPEPDFLVDPEREKPALGAALPLA